MRSAVHQGTKEVGDTWPSAGEGTFDAPVVGRKDMQVLVGSGGASPAKASSPAFRRLKPSV